jgi:hypothetical protein
MKKGIFVVVNGITLAGRQSIQCPKTQPYN